jgi:hypothetical protein
VPLGETGEAANRLGAWVATCTGATPDALPSTTERMLKGWIEELS